MKYEEKILKKLKKLGYESHNTPAAIYGGFKGNQEVEIWRTDHKDKFTI